MTYKPYFRYETTNIDFTSKMYAPVFPVQRGLKLHSYITEKPAYTTTSRNHGTTKFTWKSENTKKTDRDSLYSFWETTLNSGYNNFTIIDNRGRMLFESSWNDWNESWKKQRGGLHDIEYNIESPVPITLPCFGAYLMTENNLNSHNLDDNSAISLVDGVLVDIATDNTITRTNGYALRLTNNVASLQTGASASVEWEKSTEYNNLSLFCQFKMPAINNGFSDTPMNIIEVLNGTNSFCIRVDNNDANSNIVYGHVNNNGSTVNVRRSELVYHEVTKNTWYDCAFTYDAINGKTFLYIVESGISFTNFLYGKTDITENIGEYGNTTVLPINKKIDSIRLLYKSNLSTMSGTDKAYIQNAMVFDGFLSCVDFNTLRRLCFMWNGKSTVYPK